VKKHFRQTFCPASCSRCIFKNSDSRERKNFSRSHAIAWQSGVESRTTRRIEFYLLPLPPLTNASSRLSRCLPLYRQTSLHLVCRVVSHCTAKLPSQHPVVSSIALPYRPLTSAPERRRQWGRRRRRHHRGRWRSIPIGIGATSIITGGIAVDVPGSTSVSFSTFCRGRLLSRSLRLCTVVFPRLILIRQIR